LPLAERGPAPLPITPPSQQEIRAAIERGVGFFIQHQNKDGSWGTPRQKGINVGVPVPMGHLALRTAVTSLAVMALIEVDSDQPGAAEALEHGEDWLIKNLPKVRYCNVYIMFNNWAHAYGTQAMLRMLRRRPMDPERENTIRVIIEDQVDRLVRYQHYDGGWGYYSGGPMVRQAASMTFITAAAAIALYEAKDAGFEVPDTTRKMLLGNLRRNRRPDFAYLYGSHHRRYPLYDINHAPGSLARSQACNAATYLWGDEKVTLGIIKAWLNRLYARNGWLDIPRKHLFPHSGYYSTAGYFYYFGHYYAGVCIDLLPSEERPHFQDHLAHILLSHQEKDGSWWDFPLYNYHQPYGTAFAMMALQRCLRPDGVEN